MALTPSNGYTQNVVLAILFNNRRSLLILIKHTEIQDLLLLNTLLFLGVIIQTIEPGMVDTNMASAAVSEERPLPKFMSFAKYTTVSVNKFVTSAVNSIGGADCHEGHVMHYVVNLLTKVQGKSQAARTILKDLNDVGR